MTLVPAFEIGVWNAWILYLPVVLMTPFYLYIGKKRTSPASLGITASKTEKIIGYSLSILDILVMIYSIFLPLTLRSAWLYTGLPIALLGGVGIIMAGISWATTPSNEPITRGLYRYSRNPLYVSMFVIHLGVGIATASWLLFLYTAIYIVGMSVYIRAEEEGCLEKNGDSYRDYMQKIPRWFGRSK